MGDVDRRLVWPEHVVWRDDGTGDRWALRLKKKGRGCQRLCVRCGTRCVERRGGPGCGQQARYSGVVVRVLLDGSDRRDAADTFVCFCCAEENSAHADALSLFDAGSRLENRAGPGVQEPAAETASRVSAVQPDQPAQVVRDVQPIPEDHLSVTDVSADTKNEAKFAGWPWELAAGAAVPVHENPTSAEGLLAVVEEREQQTWAVLIETRLDLSAARISERSLSNRVRRLRAGYLKLRAENREQRSTIRDLAERAAAAERRAVDALIHASADPKLPGKVRSVQEAVAVAAERLPAVSIPAEVAVAAESLDESGRRRARGRAVLNALTALHLYAIDGLRGGDFKQWCLRGGNCGVVLSGNAVTMNESAGVQRDKRMLQARWFPVDSLLGPTGRRKMVAHVRLDNGPTAPRLYFWDDTRGATGKVHVGYIGPHLSTVHDPT